VIVFVIFTGKQPFQGSSDFQIFEKILALDYEIPDYVPYEARELIESLLKLDPA
jgi:3-phosphoinositide dependent protein kinase-1